MRSEPPTGDELTRLLVSMKRNVLEQVAQEAASAKRSSLTDRVIAIAIGVALLLGIGGGAAFAFGILPPLAAPPTATAASTPTPTPTPAPTPKATTTPAPTAPPVEIVAQTGPPPSRYGLECATMIDESLVSALFTTAVAPADPIVTATGVGITIPRRTSILSEGGTVCIWSNGVGGNDVYGASPEYVGVTVSVLPRPAEGWSDLAVAHGMPSDGARCTDSGCWAGAAVGDAWVAVEALGSGPNAPEPSSWQPFVDAIIEAVNAAGPAAAPTTPDRRRPPLPDDCEEFLPLETVRSITRSPEAVPQGRGGGWSEWAEARAHAGNRGCNWGGDEADYAASVEWVRDGRWAYERMLEAGTALPLDLAGLGAGDEASIRCDERFGSSCAVALAVGSDWLNVSGNDEATAIALAEAVLAQLSP